MRLRSAVKAAVPRPLYLPLIMMRQRLRWVSSWMPHQIDTLIADATISDAERDLLRNVSTRIYRNDTTYDTPAHYYHVGLSAIRCIDGSLQAAGVQSIRSVLDLPCGSGRVLRFLVRRFPEAQFTACDLEPGAVGFCAATFGAIPVLSSTNLDTVTLARNFDLIWCGSLVTHLNEAAVTALFKLFCRHLPEGGVLVFSTHGDTVHRQVVTRARDYGLTPKQLDRLDRRYAEAGFGFECPEGEQNYGVSLTSHDWIRAHLEAVGLREVFFRYGGWDNHQDVFGCVRA